VTDKDGKKLQIGSTVASRKIGMDNFTVKGKVIAMDEGCITFRTFRNESISYATPANIKRIKYRVEK
jgi:hypothetical protein